jgi:hypothetical protein
VTDRESLVQFLDDYMVEMVTPSGHTSRLIEDLCGREADQNTHVVIRGPQGCGKSRTIMSKILEIYQRDPGVILISSPSIFQAEEKIETFRQLNSDERFIPYLYLSLTALYQRYCPKDKQLGHLAVLEDGCSSWLRAVYEQQVDVYNKMFEYRNRLTHIIRDGKILLLFGTHETMRQHSKDGMTRLFYADGFDEKWFQSMSWDDRQTWRKQMLNHNQIHRVVVDEVAAHDLIRIHQSESSVGSTAVQAKSISTTLATLPYVLRSIQEYLAARTCEFENMDWDLFNQVVACRYNDDHIVEVSDKEIPFDETTVNKIYRETVGKHCYICLDGWSNRFSRAIMLTTEAVPMEIIRSIDQESRALGQKEEDRFQVYELLLPDWCRDIVTVELNRNCKKTSLAALVRVYHKKFPTAEIIADMVKKHTFRRLR